MNKETKKLLKDLNTLINNLMGGALLKDSIKSTGDCEISLKRNANGKAEVICKGSKLGILTGLAGLEQQILRELNVTSEIFEMIKLATITEEAENE